MKKRCEMCERSQFVGGRAKIPNQFVRSHKSPIFAAYFHAYFNTE
jgi:hypothetical protein